MGAIRPSGGAMAKGQGTGTIGREQDGSRDGGLMPTYLLPPTLATFPPSPPPQPTHLQPPTPHSQRAKRQNFWG